MPFLMNLTILYLIKMPFSAINLITPLFYLSMAFISGYSILKYDIFIIFYFSDLENKIYSNFCILN